MISKIALKVGLGVVLFSGIGGGIAAWQLGGGKNPNNSPTDTPAKESEKEIIEEFNEKYLLAITEDANDQPTDDLKEGEDKNYSCQWIINNETKKDDACEVKQIKFDSANKTAFLSNIVKKNNSDAFEGIDKKKLQKANNLFLLKVEEYVFDDGVTKINIVEKIQKNNQLNKKYAILKPIVKIVGKKLLEGQTNFVLAQFISADLHMTSTTENVVLHCTFKEAADFEHKPCDIYKFSPEQKDDNQISENLSFDSGNIEKINASSENTFTQNNFYLINFKKQKQNLTKQSIPTTIVITRKSLSETTTIGNFEIKSFLINKEAHEEELTWDQQVDTVVLGY